ncbi:flavin reductase [Gordonia sp. SID5947]|uniref:flavin reductase family protein n=1 Tax=Gordonia sp. SID5947 TaxID=2690315 RepID=UPI00136EB622|nr:flavin reductase family protein [Gordonia sp. SID5947]MYR07946.1 flavin reductase [Gordonia sp. SID5947]
MSSTIDQRKFRDVVAHFPTGVAVVTSATASGPAGMTLQSFMSLSLDPALVLLAVDRSSTTWPRVADEGKLLINVLAEGQSELARQFARSGTDKFAAVDLVESDRTDHPLLHGSVAWFDCTIVDQHPGGDHLIAVCSINDFDTTLDQDSLHPSPLVFFRSQFPTIVSATPGAVPSRETGGAR